MGYKFLEEITPFILSAWKEYNIKLGKFRITLREREKSMSFSEDGRKYVSFTLYYKGDEYFPKGRKVVFSEGMTPKEKQSLYSKIKAFVKKNLKVKKLYTDGIEALPPAELVTINYNPTDPIGVIRLHNRDIALIRAYFDYYKTPFSIEISVLHENGIDPFRFIKITQSENAESEKIQPVTLEEELAIEDDEEKEGDEEKRKHQIGVDFDIVENTTNTDEDNHGGDSIAHEVENGLSRDDGITAKSERDDSAVPASDTGDDTSDNQSGGFQNADGEPSSDSVDNKNSMDTNLDNEKLSLVASKNCSQAIPNPDETAGSQEGNTYKGFDKDSEGKIMDAVVDENAQESRGEGVLDIIEEFISERSFNPPRNGKGEAQLLVEKYKNEEIDERVFRKLQGIFKKHLSISSVGKESPTLDKKLLIKKLMSFQSPYTAFKKDIANEKILLLVDVSGSMTNFYDLIPYFYRLTVVLKDIIVVVNSNMYPEIIIEFGKATYVNPSNNYYNSETYAVYSELLKKYSIKTIVNFTDFDGVEITADILAKTNANMVIMDVYSCNVLNYVPFKDEEFKKLPEALMPYRNRIIYYYGVGDFAGVLWVLNKEL